MSDFPHSVSAIIVKGKPVRLRGQLGSGHSAGHGAAQHKPLLPRRRAAQGRARFPAVDSALASPSMRTPPRGRWCLSQRRFRARFQSSWCPLRNSLVVQWLDLRLPKQGVWVGSLVRKLRSPMPWGQEAKHKTEAIL